MPNNNKKELHPYAWEFRNVAPVVGSAGSNIVADPNQEFALYVQSATLQYLYSQKEDAWMQITSGALAGTFGNGACGEYHPWSRIYTANGGSTTSITVLASTHNISGLAVGKIIEFQSGTAGNIGVRRTITAVDNNGGQGNVTISFAAVPSACANADTFIMSTGRFFVMGAGTIASGIFKAFDLATMTWVTYGTTGLPATWTNDGRLVTFSDPAIQYLSGTATAGGASTLTNSAKAWAVNNFCNYQIRTTGGTGAGQVRTIASNTATVITVSTAWTIVPDATSTYAIEGNRDFIYLLGNNAVTMYRYSLSADSWSTMAPTTARAGAPSTGGFGAEHVKQTGNALWALETNLQDGRYIISTRGNGAVIDRFDIAGGTAGAGAWAVLNITGFNETLAAGTSLAEYKDKLYIRHSNLHRFYVYDIPTNVMKALTQLTNYPEATAAAGGKMWVRDYDGSNSTIWLYSLRNSGTELFRCLIY